MNNSPKCLLIEDDVDDQEIFCMAVHKIDAQIECIISKDGVQAIKLLEADQSLKPDYIFIDVNMPKMDGMECLRRIKELPQAAESIIFMFSTSSEPTFIDKSKILGANCFIVKPPALSLLTEKLEEIFKTNRATR